MALILQGSTKNLSISQFSGFRAISELRCIPTGYLPEEPKVRAQGATRGRHYWSMGGKSHLQEYRVKVNFELGNVNLKLNC